MLRRWVFWTIAMTSRQCAGLQAVTLAMLLEAAGDELGGQLGEAVLCAVMSNLTMVGGQSVLNTRSTRQ